ncbi:MAG: 50S ribosomal protein P1 [Nitrososphaerota archaeon]|nr:50S ribosomal protein P1 [Candidatus Calditenuaceae archaeon]MDW8072919.1 50S ribosomal protein P1 [Nitrososphaerota archaeon]
MEYVYAALLLHRLGKEINEENISNVIKAAGGSVDEVRVKALVAALQGVNIDEAIRSASFAPAVAAQPQAPAPTPQQKPAAEAKKEEAEEKREEEALAGLSALFG